MSTIETPAEPTEPTWSVSTALLFVLLWMLLTVVVQFGFLATVAAIRSATQGIGFEDAANQIAQSQSLAVLIAFAGCVALTWLATFALLRQFLRRFPRDRVLAALGMNPPPRDLFYLAGFPVGFGLIVASGLLGWLLNPEQQPSPFDEVLKTPGGAATVTLLAVIVAPICEEVFFRGFVLPPMLKRFSLGSAMAFNGAVFAGVHIITYGDAMRFTWIPPLFLFGFVLSGLRVATNSVGPGIVAHVVFNASSILLFLLSEPTPPGT